jgi:hypothetical protein
MSTVAIFILAAWLMVQVLMMRWLFRPIAGWSRAQKQRLHTRHTLVPFYRRWRTQVAQEDVSTVQQWRRRAQIWFWLSFFGPMLVMNCWLVRGSIFVHDPNVQPFTIPFTGNELAPRLAHYYLQRKTRNQTLAGLLDAWLHSTPDDLHWWSPPWTYMAVRFLLDVKDTYLQQAHSSVAVVSGAVTGCVFGAPGKQRAELTGPLALRTLRAAPRLARYRG